MATDIPVSHWFGLALLCSVASASLCTADDHGVPDDHVLSLMQRGYQMTRGSKVPASSMIGLPGKLHFLSMGRSGSSFLGELFGTKSGRPYVFEPFNVEGNGQGLWSKAAPTPNYNARRGNGWKDSPATAEGGPLMRKLRCIYECKGCREISLDPAAFDDFCTLNSQSDKVVVKTVALANASTLLRLPRDSLRGSKFVVLLRDPRGITVHDTSTCARMLSLSLSAKALAEAIGKENVRTVFYEHLARNVEHTVQELAEWANIPMSAALASAKQMPGDHPSDWLSEGEKATERANEPWCAEYMQLVGYPSNKAIAAIANLPEDTRRASLDYSHLVDPALSPPTADQEHLLNRFWHSGDGYSWLQSQTETSSAEDGSSPVLLDAISSKKPS